MSFLSSERAQAVRRRKSYRLLVLSFRGLLISIACVVPAQVLASNEIIGRRTAWIVIAPCALLFVVSWVVGLVTILIEMYNLSVVPIGRGTNQRQSRFGSLLFVDLFTLRIGFFGRNSDRGDPPLK